MLSFRALRSAPAAAAAVAIAAFTLLAWTAPAQAGCGCDHPPPAFTSVMPPFGSPGKTVHLWQQEGFAFEPGASYAVSFGDVDTDVVAAHAERLAVPVPVGARPGPASIRVQGPGVDHTYASTQFTVLAPAPLVPSEDGVFAHHGFEAAVSEGGTLLIPFNLSQVSDATQFGMVLALLPLTYAPDDVVFYNADGVDLTLFTLAVDDPTQRQWGSYHGWSVEQDTGIEGEVYESKVLDSVRLRLFSDLLTYWRHEFHTYRTAHAPGGSHAVDTEGFHPDGTLHIDHDHLVLAISGELRDFTRPQDPDRNRPLHPGSHTVTVYWANVLSDHPVDPAVIEEALAAARSWGVPVMPLEPPSAYDLEDEEEEQDEDEDENDEEDD